MEEKKTDFNKLEEFFELEAKNISGTEFKNQWVEIFLTRKSNLKNMRHIKIKKILI